MELQEAEFLTSISGILAIESAENMLEESVSTVNALSRLRKRHSVEEAAAIWNVAEARKRGRRKLGDDARQLLLDREGFEMSSSQTAARYHADLLWSAGCTTVVDLCGGLGMDAIAFARRGLKVTAYEIDAARARLLQANVARLNVDDRVTVVHGDVCTVELCRADAAFFDPARRVGERRWARDAAETIPPLSLIDTLSTKGYASIIAKLSPAINRSVRLLYSADLHFLSIGAECKEALLLIGAVAEGGVVAAVKAKSGERFCSRESGKIRDVTGPYIWEPDPAIARAGLTGALASTLNGWQCDPHNDYFFTDVAASSPFAACYLVQKELAFTRNALQSALDGVGRVILKQRGFPLPIEDVRSRLKLKGDREQLVILAGFGDKKCAFLVQHLSTTGGDDSE